MSNTTITLPKIASMLASIVITLGIQSALVAGFDHMARQSQVATELSTDAPV